LGAHSKVLETVELVDGFMHLRCLVPTHHRGVSLRHHPILQVLTITIVAVTVIVMTIIVERLIIVHWVISIALLSLTHQKRRIRPLQILHQQLLHVRKKTTADPVVLIRLCLGQNLGRVTLELHVLSATGDLAGTLCVAWLGCCCSGVFFLRVG
jgi:hypothetical protein